jgi:hypothetical protein
MWPPVSEKGTRVSLFEYHDERGSQRLPSSKVINMHLYIGWSRPFIEIGLPLGAVSGLKDLAKRTLDSVWYPFTQHTGLLPEQVSNWSTVNFPISERGSSPRKVFA